MKAYDILFGHEQDALSISTHPAGTRAPVPDAFRAGWIGTRGPRLGTAWPRGALTRLPMMHVLTLELPAEYQRRGAVLPAVSFFAGEGDAARPLAPETDLDDPFFTDLTTATKNPNEQQYTDEMGFSWALVWLTPEQLASGPGEVPADPRRPGQHVADDDGPNAWDQDHPTVPAWLVDRKDPNAGRAPVDDAPADGDPVTGYLPPYGDDDDHGLRDWARPFADPCTCHLGGTAMPVQELPEGLTPYYLELEELPGVNIGGGNCQIDLESGVFDWAC
ncbi:hypothetical protein [Promicromonospora sp. NFX87]|uniref:hypothetical protein n=1 Tax=Promicromonospora sp. NFX87 TaxID=3402691 RepID=UPI003AFB5EB3